MLKLRLLNIDLVSEFDPPCETVTKQNLAQIEILESAVGWRNVKFDETIAKAREAGVDVDMEGLYDDQEEEEEEEE